MSSLMSNNSLAFSSNCYLPSELLLTIFGFLDHEDLYTLTQTSTHFSHLSLISYFARRKVFVTPDGRVDLPDAPKTMEMLPFLRKARFINSINRLSCGIVQPHRLFLEHISYLAAILRHTRSVEKFTLDFYVSGEPWSSSMVKQINAGNALFNALNELFTLAARVCRSVMVRNGTALRAVLKEAGKGGFQKGLSSWSLTRLFASDKSPKRRTSNSIPDSLSPPVFPAAPAKGALRVLEINSILLLSSPFIGWTIRSLNANDITDLIFGTIEHREIDWNTLLSQVHVPTLRCITFRGHTPFDGLINFASRHRAITTMTLNDIDMEGCFRHTASASAHESFGNKLVKAFKNIKKLACCPRGLVFLLSDFFSINNDASPVDLFPNLQSISVLWSVGIGQQLKMSVVETILAPIAEKLKAYENVSFVVTYRTDVGACIRLPSKLVPAVREPRPRPTINTETDIPNITTRSPTSATPYTGITSTTDKPSSSLFTIFNEIKIELTSRADRGGIPDLVENLAESFTKIKYVRIDTRLRTGRAPEENKAWKLYLCHHVLKHFGHLNVVFVDGTRTKVVGREG